MVISPLAAYGDVGELLAHFPNDGVQTGGVERYELIETPRVLLESGSQACRPSGRVRAESSLGWRQVNHRRTAGVIVLGFRTKLGQEA